MTDHGFNCVVRRRAAGAMVQVAAAALALVAPGGAAAQLLSLPAEATMAAQRTDARASVTLATGPWRDGDIETLTAEGAMTRRAWHVAAPGSDSGDLLAVLRKQLETAGFEVIYVCNTRACGGFDFRFALDVLPEPEMHVDLGDFRYLAARRDTDDGPEHAALLVSHATGTGFVQVTHVAPATGGAAPAVLSTRGRPAADPGTDWPRTPAAVPDLRAALEAGGAAPLDDLVFSTGEAGLDSGEFASLDALAAYLRDHPDRRITLVGHTDSEGSLAANIALSKRRAEAVRDVLVSEHGIAAARLSAEGVGYLAPRASNLSAEGRMRNRRVEAVLKPLN